MYRNDEVVKHFKLKPKYCAFEPGIYSFPFEDSKTYFSSKDENLLEGNEYFLDEEFYPDFEEDENFFKLLNWYLGVFTQISFSRSDKTCKQQLIDGILFVKTYFSKEEKERLNDIDWSYEDYFVNIRYKIKTEKK